VTVVVFTLTYTALAIGNVPKLRLDRAGIAFVGAGLVLIPGVLSIREATRPESVDYETLFLLLGMMIVVGFLKIAGFFIRAGHWSLDRIKSPRGLLAATIVLSGILSAFLVNDIVCLALTPLVLHLARKQGYNPVPHLIGLATAANIGSTGTITGNPQNMIIGVQSGIPYLHFALRLMPVALLGLVVDFFVILAVYRQALAPAATNARAAPMPEDRAPHGRAVRWLLRKSVAVALVTVVLFFCGLPIALVALGAAGLLMLNRLRPQRIYREIDWTLLLMFIGLFIVVHAFQVHVVSGWGVERWDWLTAHPVGRLSVAAAVLSNLVSNVPAVLLFEPVMRAMPEASRNGAWLALAMSSTFAGNLTILGSVANLIVVENARRERVNVGFWEYCKVGIPVTVLTLAIGIVWLVLT
jgi:Na+/H+ antiporter NhaD/arsenite permease-like protein